MRNIHIIPTDKPSKIGQSIFDKSLHFNPIFNYELEKERVIPQNLYITSDEEIKDGWVLNTHTNQVYFVQGFYGRQPITKKIILTTDDQLIKDGVQAIDDEFLHWFVNNPSCEKVEVNDWLDDNGNIAFGGNTRYQLCNHLYNKKIIPKEELKETLEEAADRLFKTHSNNTSLAEGHYDYMMDKEDFKEASLEIAKWQQKRMYSEEDLRNAFKAGREGDMVFNNESPKYWDFDTYLQSLLTTT